jgi:hypothetical protein
MPKTTCHYEADEKLPMLQPVPPSKPSMSRHYTPPGSNNADFDKLSFQHFSSSWQTHSVKL